VADGIYQILGIGGLGNYSVGRAGDAGGDVPTVKHERHALVVEPLTKLVGVPVTEAELNHGPRRCYGDIFRAAGASIEVACSLTAAHELVECGEVRQNVATFNACASWEHLVKADRHILEGQARIEA